MSTMALKERELCVAPIQTTKQGGGAEQVPKYGVYSQSRYCSTQCGSAASFKFVYVGPLETTDLAVRRLCGVTHIAAGNVTFAALRADGQVVSWGGSQTKIFFGIPLSIVFTAYLEKLPGS